MSSFGYGLRGKDKKVVDNLLKNIDTYAEIEGVSRKTIILILLYAVSLFERGLGSLLLKEVGVGFGHIITLHTGLISTILPIMCFQYFNYSPFTLYWKKSEEELLEELKKCDKLVLVAEDSWDGIKKLLPFSVQEIDKWIREGN